MKRVLWFALGVGVAAVVVWKGRELYRKWTPAGIAGQLDGARASLTESVSDFFATVSQARAEREAELREALGMDAETADVD